MNPHAEPPRLHSLDALRASAMLLGIFLHIAWFYVPVAMAAPAVDRSATEPMWYGFHTIHIFRMQAFFLVAGFFAHLLLERRGPRTFIRQRLVRIGIPFVVGWMICWPLMTWCYIWGGTRSGSIITDTSPWLIMIAVFLIPPLLRAFLNLTHLWFLYTLLWLYAATLVTHLLVTRVIDRTGSLRRRVTDAFAALMRSPWIVPLLALPTAVWMLPMDWTGVEDSGSLIPKLNSLLTYGLFFGVGWLLHGPLDLMKEFDRRWKWHLAFGLILTVPIFVFYSTQRSAGNLTSAEIYPSLSPDEIRDWPAFRGKLLEEKDSDSPTLGKNLWRLLDSPTKRFVERETDLDPNEKLGAIMQLDMLVLPNPELLADLPLTGLKLPPAAMEILARDAAKRSTKETTLLNRLVLEAAYPGAFLSGTLGDPIWRWYKLGYTAVYATASWLLVFGLLGLFRRHFNHPSPTWRYLADASYWFYLIHLPVIFFIEIPLAPLALVWPIKVTLVGVATLAILLPSYHYLVRPTIIGKVLNGRRYPIKATEAARPHLRASALPQEANRDLDRNLESADRPFT
jgi:surface polysaccharide O-acyltransferase-like enzyme